jgi:hypothetical protein
MSRRLAKRWCGSSSNGLPSTYHRIGGHSLRFRSWVAAHCRAVVQEDHERQWRVHQRELRPCTLACGLVSSRERQEAGTYRHKKGGLMARIVKKGRTGVLPARTKELPRARFECGHIGTDSRGLGILGGLRGTGGITIAQNRIARSEFLKQSDVSPRKQPAASCPNLAGTRDLGCCPDLEGSRGRLPD